MSVSFVLIPTILYNSSESSLRGIYGLLYLSDELSSLSEYSAPLNQSQPLYRNIPPHSTNQSPSIGIFRTTRPIESKRDIRIVILIRRVVLSIGIFRTTQPITAPLSEYSAPLDQSQPLYRNIPHHSTNHSPSIGIFRTTRPITAPQSEYSAPLDQSQPLNRNIPHHSTNRV
jgi:hypothetical protein